MKYINTPDILLIEPCDFEKYPKGGQLTFAKLMMSIFKNKLALVGVTTDNIPTWTVDNKRIRWDPILFFSNWLPQAGL